VANLNGQFVPADAVFISPTDPGFLWGATVTDRARTYNGVLFRLDEHLARFRRSATYCSIPLKPTDAELADIARELVARNRAADADLVVIMFATPQTLCLHTEPLRPERYGSLVTGGAKLVVVPSLPVLADGIATHAKTRSRMHWWIAEKLARNIDPDAAALFTDARGFVTETSMANILLVRDGELHSAPLTSVLQGISLKAILELGHRMGMPYKIAPITLQDLMKADELLLTSTPFGVTGVSSLNGRPRPWPGPMLLRLHAAFSELVGVDIWRGLAPGR